jgi:hypothetical protein
VGDGRGMRKGPRTHHAPDAVRLIRWPWQGTRGISSGTSITLTPRVIVAMLSAVVVVVRVTGSRIAIALRVVGVCAHLTCSAIWLVLLSAVGGV